MKYPQNGLYLEDNAMLLQELAFEWAVEKQGGLLWTRQTARLGRLWISPIGSSLWCAYASQLFFVVSQPSNPSNQLVSGDAAVTRTVRGALD